MLPKSLFLVIIILSLSGSLYFFLNPTKEESAIVYTEPIPTLPKAVDQTIEQAPPEPSPEKPSPVLAQVAIIIDDIGHRKKLAEQLLALDLNLSFSLLPHSPYAKLLARKISSKGRDLLLHLPLEPTDPKWNPGPGALMLSMSPTTMENTLINNLQGFIFIGINNHMGSKFTANPKAMQTLLSTVKANGLFYVDSLTSAKSVGYQTAQELGIKTAKRDIFLDNEQDPKAIEKQLEKLVEKANKRGSAIGLGHPYPATLAALSTYQDKLKKSVTLVGIHELVK